MKAIGFGILTFISAFCFFAMLLGRDFDSNSKEVKNTITLSVLVFSFLISLAVTLITWGI